MKAIFWTKLRSMNLFQNFKKLMYLQTKPCLACIGSGKACNWDHLWNHYNGPIILMVPQFCKQVSRKMVLFFSSYFAFESIERRSAIFTYVFVHINIHIILKNGTWASMHSMFPRWKTVWKHPFVAPKQKKDDLKTSWCHTLLQHDVTRIKSSCILIFNMILTSFDQTVFFHSLYNFNLGATNA